MNHQDYHFLSVKIKIHIKFLIRGRSIDSLSLEMIAWIFFGYANY